MNCTYASAALGEEITFIITMPEKSNNEILPFPAAVLFPDTAMESNYFMRKEPLERYGSGQIPIATVSLPGRIAIQPPSVLLSFLMDELPSILGQFPLRICALYAQGCSVTRLTEIKDALKNCYRSMNAPNEPLHQFLEDLRIILHSSEL
jgi:hypothetical protein